MLPARAIAPRTDILAPSDDHASRPEKSARLRARLPRRSRTKIPLKTALNGSFTPLAPQVPPKNRAASRNSRHRCASNQRFWADAHRQVRGDLVGDDLFSRAGTHLGGLGNQTQGPAAVIRGCTGRCRHGPMRPHESRDVGGRELGRRSTRRSGQPQRLGHLNVEHERNLGFGLGCRLTTCKSALGTDERAGGRRTTSCAEQPQPRVPLRGSAHGTEPPRTSTRSCSNSSDARATARRRKAG